MKAVYDILSLTVLCTFPKTIEELEKTLLEEQI